MARAANRLTLVGLTLLAALGSPGLHGQNLPASSDVFPAKPIRWIVPFPPGGPSDMVARIVGQALGVRIKRPVIIDNRGGAFGIIGMEAAARAAPDGYTILFGAPGTVVIDPILYKLNFDPLTDLTAVSQLAAFNFILLASPDFPPRTVPEALAAAKARPGTVTCGSGATLQQLGCELLKIQGRVDLNVIPYKGGAPAMNDLVGGRIHLVFDTPNAALPQLQANRVRAIATTGRERNVGPLGHLPTVNEALPGFELLSWFGVLAPGATPRQIVERLNREIAGVLGEDELHNRLTDSGLEVAHGSPEAFADLLVRDRAKYSKIIREAGIRAEGEGGARGSK
ncbi:MAG TPA: tripartite tricarboxylate transporter substrate binding protein [Burkholderiales bacterium]|nr:tripartite tricarboxylate transporter substrate binding protein [Burkholderiales bacterium]